MRNFLGSYLSAAAATAACLTLSVLGTTGAQAQVTFTLNGSGPSTQGITVSNYGGAATDTASGPYAATLNGVAGEVFCCDFTHDIDFGDSYQANDSYDVTSLPGLQAGSYYAGGLASAVISGNYGSSFAIGSATATQRADEVAWLAATYMGATASTFSNDATGSTSLADNESGVTIAIWDIIQDGVNGGVTSTSSSLTSLASYYETLASGHSAYNSSSVLWVQAPIALDGSHQQNFMYLSNANLAPVTEPGFIVTALSLIALLGLSMVRGRRRSTREKNLLRQAPAASRQVRQTTC